MDDFPLWQATKFQPHFVIGQTSLRLFNDLQRIIGRKIHFLKQLSAITARTGETTILQEIFKVIPGWVFCHTERTIQNIIRICIMARDAAILCRCVGCHIEFKAISGFSFGVKLV